MYCCYVQGVPEKMLVTFTRNLFIWQKDIFSGTPGILFFHKHFGDFLGHWVNTFKYQQSMSWQFVLWSPGSIQNVKNVPNLLEENP